jgi:hypothetical protein
VLPLPLLKLSQALTRLKPPPHARNPSLEFLWPARGLLPTVLPSLSSDSWPFPRHLVRRSILSLSAQSWRPRSHPSTRLPQVRRLHRRREEQRHPQPFILPRSDFPRSILIARPRSWIPLRARGPCAPGPPVSARVSWRWACSVSALSPSVADTP